MGPGTSGPGPSVHDRHIDANTLKGSDPSDPCAPLSVGRKVRKGRLLLLYDNYTAIVVSFVTIVVT